MPIDSKALPDASAYHVHVALRELSRREILQAVAEYDRLGQVRFLEKYEFGAARSYRLVVDGKTYDSKAIVGAAHGFLPGQEPLTGPLPVTEFTFHSLSRKGYRWKRDRPGCPMMSASHSGLTRRR